MRDSERRATIADMPAFPVVVSLLVLIGSASTVGACTIFLSEPVAVGSSFQLSLRDAVGVTVRLRGAGSAEYSAVTDAQGIARFANLHSGSYSVRVQDDLEFSDREFLEVSADKQPGLTIPIPSRFSKRVVSRSLAGILLMAGEALERGSAISIDLLDRAGKELRRTVTDPAGRFSFPAMPPGRYMLRLSASSAGDGLIPVEVHPGAGEGEMQLELSWSSCGLEYLDRRQCAGGANALQVRQLAGWVRDAAGAGIGNAQIILLDSSDKIIEQSRSDNAGSFILNSTAPGGYRLMIASSPFMTLRTDVSVNPSFTAGKVVAELALAGCGKASVR